MATLITSENSIPIEQHFRVSAGPGAGKTYWLIKHIKNVLHTSSRLQKTRKIACITYTNVAVETIQKRLGNSSNRVEVSTIHSFLYKHIVKPYVSFIAEEYGLNVELVDGHDDRILSNYSFLGELKSKTEQKWIQDNQVIISSISKVRWEYVKNELKIKATHPVKVGKYFLKKSTYDVYKKMAWAKGVLHHDDLLFFSYHLLRKFPFIIRVLNAKFPYFFVDEFQDSNPIQVKILEMIGNRETKIGVIGDKAQSIYEFQGADPKQFENFSLEGLCSYEIHDNRRSSNQIVNFLNHIRTDFAQQPILNKDAEIPYLFIGDTLIALEKAKSICGSEEIHVLSYKNETCNAIKQNTLGSISGKKFMDEFQVSDSNWDRRNVVLNCAKAIELAKINNFKDAIKSILLLFDNKKKRKKDALNILTTFLKSYDKYADKNLFNFFDSFINPHLKNHGVSHPDVTKGKPFEFYSNYTYKQLVTSINLCFSGDILPTAKVLAASVTKPLYVTQISIPIIWPSCKIWFLRGIPCTTTSSTDVQMLAGNPI